MANAYFYSNLAQQTTLSGSVSAGATSIGVGATTGLPGSFPYVLALDYGGATEELVVVTAAAGTTLTVTRGHSGTSAQSHSLGAVVRHVYHAGDATDFRTHEAATSGVHGVTGDLVGATMTQTLTNKTLTSPTINNATYANGGSLAGTFSGTPIFSGAGTTSGAWNFTGAPVFTGNPVFQGGAAATVASSHRVSGDSTPRLQVRADGQLQWGPGNAAADTVLYREAASIMGTEDALRFTRAATADDVIQARVSGDAGIRFLMETNGLLGWGDGSSFTMDTVLYRSAANVLKTDDSLHVAGDVVVTGDLTAANVPAFASGSTTFNFSATSQVDVAISFPASRFSAAPKVVATLTSLPAGSSALIVRASAVTSSGMTLRCNDVGGASRTLAITCDWVAVEE
ncbi:hypothetical protein ACGF5F_29640 [Streptomyces sp. NPDC047821]|uniref:hypothetical protein n=1 Tax=Streptomyces sp. NPDC047821 TaxID=3365488 RepID=UPI00371434E1